MADKEKVKPLPKIVGRYFDAWIRRSTWYTGHLTDDEYFFKFVKAVLRYCRNAKRPGDSQVRHLIELKGSDTIKDSECLHKKARHYSGLYASILEFHDTPFPDVLIERTSPILCYYALERQCTDKPDIAPWMRRLFGDDWKKKMEEQRNRLC